MSCNCHKKSQKARFSCLARCGNRFFALFIKRNQVIIVKISKERFNHLRHRGAKICVSMPKKGHQNPPSAIRCCSKSHLRGEGIKRVQGTSNLYFADANLICTGDLCSGRDRNTIYEWTLTPTDKANPGQLRIVGSSRKIGNDRVEIAGTGTFDLGVKVTFTCTRVGFRVFVDHCVSTRTVRFTQ